MVWGVRAYLYKSPVAGDEPERAEVKDVQVKIIKWNAPPLSFKGHNERANYQRLEAV